MSILRSVRLLRILFGAGALSEAFLERSNRITEVRLTPSCLTMAPLTDPVLQGRPARAVIKISARLVADQRPEEAVEQIRKAVQAAAPKGTRAEFRVLHPAPASLVDPEADQFRWSACSMST